MHSRRSRGFWWKSWLKGIWNRERKTRARHADAAPAIELLESRTLLSAFDFTKSVVASDNPNAAISPAIGGGVSFNAPGTSGNRFTGVINSTYLATNALDSDIQDIDADDLITFAIVFDNTSTDDLFDIAIRDLMPNGFAIPSSGLNLRVSDGNNNSYAYTDLGGGLFASGIQLDDSGVGAVAADHASSGADVVVVTYDLQFSGTGQRTIDGFTASPQNVEVYGIGSATNAVTGPASEIYGTERELTVEVTQSSSGRRSRSRVLTFSPGVLVISNSSGNDSNTTVKWDGVGSSGLTGTDRDLLEGGGVGIVMDVVAADTGVSVTVNLTDGDGDIATQTVSNLVAGETAQFQFAAFSNLANVNLRDISSIEVAAYLPPSGDAELDTVGILTVPSVATNTATLFNVATSEGGPDLTVTDCDASSTSTVADLSVSKSVTTTNQSHTTGSNVAVGEIVTYTATITVPEGTDDNVQLVDTLDVGLTFVDVVSVTASSGDLSTDVGTFDNVRANAAFSNVGGGSVNDGQGVTLDFGGVANNNRDNNTVETITVVYRAVVMNASGNNRGLGLNNSVTISSDKGSDSDSATDVVIVEPELQVTKTLGAGTFDAGDTVSVTLNVVHTGTSDADAFNVNILDMLPTGMTNVQNVVVTPANGAAGVTDNSTGSWLDVDIDTFPIGGTVQITFDAELTGSIAPNQLINNTANIAWTSLPGDVSSAQSSLNTMTDERDGSDGVGGALDDHAGVGSDSLTTQTVTSATKSIVATSESHTPEGTADTVGDPRTVAIGEVVRYRLHAVIPEGTLTDTRLVDVLPAGLSLVDNTEVRVSWTADSDVTEEADVSGADNDAVAPTFVLPASRIGTSGQTVTFDLGDIVNNDRDAGAELITLEFNVLVNNESANQDGTQHSNDFDVQVNGAVLASSNSVVTEVREPGITDVDKRLISFTETTATYRITLSNTGNTTAFDTRVADTMPAGLLSLQTGTVSVTLAGGASGTTDTSAATALDVSIATIPVGGSVQVDYTTSLLDTASAITNTADVTYTSLPGAGTSGNTTGTDTPASSGASNGERDGSDGAGASLNNFADSDSVVLGSIGNRVWLDLDADGTQDAGEAGVNGVPVTLVDAGPDGSLDTTGDNSTYSTTTSNVGGTDGLYSFGALPAGLYRVDFGTVNGLAWTSQHAAADDIDSDAHVGDGHSPAVPLATGEVITHVDAGLLPIDLSLTKSVDDNSPRPGDNVTFTLTLDNAAGRSDATGVTVTDVLPAGLTFVSATPSAAYNDTTGVWTVGALASGSSTQLTLTATVTAGTGAVTNIAQVSTADQPDLDSTPNNTVPSEDDQDSASLTPTGAISGVFFWDMDTGADQDASEPIVGGATVRLYADADANGSPDGASIGSTTTNAGTGAYRFDDLTAGNYLVEFVTPNGERFTARDAVADTIDSDANPANGLSGTLAVTSGNQVSDVDAGLLPIDLSLIKTVDDSTPAPGSNVIFTLLLSNAAGLSDATGVGVADILPAGLTLVSTNQPAAYNDTTGVWTVGTLASGSSDTLTITATVDVGTGAVTNVAQVSAANQLDVDSTPANSVSSEDDHDDASLVPTGSLSGVFFWDMDLGADQDASEQIVGGATVRLYNDADMNGAPDGASVASTTTNAGTGAYRFDDLSPSNYVVEFITPHGETFTAQDAVADTIDSDVVVATGLTGSVAVTSGNETPDVDAGLLPIDLSLTKTADDSSPAPGSNVVFTLTLTNAAGHSAANGVTVEDVLPAGLTFVSTNQPAAYNDATGIWTVGSLSAGASDTLTITATVDVGTGQVTNIAQVETANQPDTDSTPANEIPSEDDQNNAVVTPTAAIQGVFFWDMDSGADQDASEPIVGGATVRLYADANTDGAPDGGALASTTSNAGTGAYLFDDLTPGSYLVEFIQPNGERFTARDAVGDTIDSDAVVSTGLTGTLTAKPGQVVDDVDAGLLPIDLSLTKAVADDTPTPGSNVIFTLSLANVSGLSDATNVSVSDVLPAGLTFVSANPAASYDDTTGVWTIGTVTSGSSTTLDITATVDVGTGVVTNVAQVTVADQLDVDSTPNNSVPAEDDQDSQQLTPTGSLSGVLFWDMDSGGDQDASEPSVVGQTVNLFVDANTDGIPDGAAIASTTTSGADGSYRFDDLAPGTYLVGFTTPNGETFTAQDAVADTIDSDADRSDGQTGTVVVLSGNETTDVDGGLLPIDLSLTKTVDDSTPAPGSNVTFTLNLANAAGLSGATGVNVSDVLPAGLTFVSASPGANYDDNTGVWSVGSVASGTSTVLTIVAAVDAGTGAVTNVAQVMAADQLDVDSTPNNSVASEDDQDDASIVPTGSLSGVFFWDMDIGGDQDAAEPIVGGATVLVYADTNMDGAPDGAAVANATTNGSTGAYRFDSLAPSNYVVEFLTPNGETFTARDAVNDSIDSDAIVGTGLTGSLVVTSGNETPDVDAGLLPIDLALTKTVDDATPAPGSNVVFTLTLSNAAGRSTATGVTVEDVLPSGLTFVSASPAANYNDSSGTWTVGSLASGTSTVLTVTATVDVGTGAVTNVGQVETADQPDTDSTPGNGIASEDDQDAASLTPTTAITGVFFWDTDSGADQDASEPIVGGAIVRLYNDADANGIPDGAAIATQTTNVSTGAYLFDNLTPGNFLVEFVRPNGERFTTQDAVAEAIDSDADAPGGLTGTLVAASGQLLDDVDAGLLPIDLSITKTVDNVTPLPGANVTFTLTLANAAGLSDATNVTAEDALPAGLTFVSANPAAAYNDTTGIWTVGSLASGASTVLTVTANVDAGTGTVTNVAQVETADQVDRDSTPANDVPSEDDQDSQVVTTNGALSGVFFWDTDLGGDQDASETTVGSATVRLYLDANMDDAPDGAAIATTTTNGATGAYRFDGLNPNNYVVEFVRPNGETFTARDAVGDTIDSDADVTTGFTTTRAVSTGQETIDVDAGLLPIDLSLSKTVDDATPAPGSNVTFTLNLVNSAGLSNATGVTVGDVLPAGLTFVSANPSANYNDTFGTWTVGSLASGASTALTITATVDAGTGPVTNVAQVMNADQVDVDSTPNNSVSSEDDQDDASIVPTGSLSGVFFWDVDLGGDQDASEPTVGGATVRLYEDANTDGTPDGAAIATTTTNAATGAYRFEDLGGTYVVEFVTPNGETFTTQNAVGDTIDSDANVANGLTGTVTALSGNETQDVDAGLLPIDLALTKAVDNETPAPGSNVVFTLSLSNAVGLSDASGVVVEDALPVGLTFVSASPSAAYDSNTNLWTVGSLASGSSTSLTITATVNAGTGEVTNVAQVNAADQPDVDSAPNNNVASEDDQYDATITPTASIEGVFFWDMDSGADQDASEPIVGGATVRLFADPNADGLPDGSAIASQTTDAGTGAYRFDDLSPGGYLVHFTQPNGERFTARDAVGDAIDSDAVPATGFTGTVTAMSGQVTSDVDAGLLPIDLSLIKTVDDDTPAPGANVVFTLSLSNATGLSDASTVTVTDVLPAGLTFVSASPAANYDNNTGVWTVGTLTSGSSTALTITASVDTGTGAVTNVAQVSAADQLDVDSTPANSISSEDDQDSQPLTPTGALSGVFFWDMDTAGDQDAAEPIVGVATVRLYRDSNADGAADGGVIDTTVTNAATGAYHFDGLSPDGYVVEFVTPNGETFTARDAVSDAIDSDVTPATGFTGTAFVLSGNETTDVDAGLLPIDLSLSKSVDDDTPNPGSNVVFTLTLSNATGLSPATGVTVIDVLPAGLTFVSANPAANYDSNSGVWTVGTLAPGGSTTLDITATVNVGTGVVTNIAQVSTADQPDLDSTPSNSVPSEDDQDSQSLTPTGSLSGVQFWDLDAAGDQDAGEPIVGGQTVRLYLDADANGAADGASIASTTTNGVTGAYRFDGLTPNNYIVEFTTPNGETFTAQDAVTDAIDSDANVSNGRTGTVVVVSGNETTDVDAGLLPIDLSITKTVDDDRPSAGQAVTFTLTLSNAAGFSDASGVVVEDVLPSGLTFVSANPAADYADSTGLWTVGSLASGASRVLTVTATVDAGTGLVTNVAQVNAADQPDSDSTPDNDVTTEDDQDSQVVTTLGTIAGVFFWDMDLGGDQDASEPVVSGATVHLYQDNNTDGVADSAAIDTQTTNASGAYRFDGLDPGGFLVGFVVPNGERFTAQDAAGDTIDSDANPSHGLTGTVTVTAGQLTDDVDSGLLPIDLSLTKSVDDSTPAPGSNVVFTLTLSNAAGLSNATGINVADALPTGLTFVSANPAADFDNDTGIWNAGSLAAGASKSLVITATVDAGTGTVTNVAQVAAAHQLDVDSTPGNNVLSEDDQDAASLTPTASLSGVFFMDMDSGGDQDPSEPIVGGASVLLYLDANQDGTADGASIASTTSNATTGAYRFDDLAPGGYVVEFREPNGERFTVRDAVSDAIDSDVHPGTGFTGTAIVLSGNETPDVDAGLLPIDLSLTKTVDDATPAPGSAVTFTLTASNAAGLSDATGVRVTDVLPGGLTFVSANPSAAYNGSTGEWNVGSLTAGLSASLTITATVDAGTGAVTNVAQVSAADQLDRDSTPNNSLPSEDDQDDATITPTASIEGAFFWDMDLAGDQDVTEPIVRGATVRLFVDANTDGVPDGSAIANATTNVGTGAYRFDGLTPGGYVVQFTQPNGERFTLRDNVGDTIDSDVNPSTALTSTVTASAGQVVSDVDAGLLPIDLSLTKSVNNSTPGPGSNVVFTLLLSNSGGHSDATGVAVTDVLPAGLTFVSANLSAAFNGNTGVWSVGSLAAGGSASLTITATVDAGTGAVTNVAQVTAADQPDVDSTPNSSVPGEDDQDDARLTPTGSLSGVFFWDMDVAGDQDASEPTVGGASVRLYRDSNADGSPDGGVIASTTTNASTGAYRFDGLPADGYVVEFVAPNGESFTTRDAVADNRDSDVIPATGFTGQVTVTSGNETPDVDAGLLPIDLSLTKGVNDDSPEPGANVTFTLTLANAAGLSNASGVSVTDVLPTGLTFVSANPSAAFNSSTGVWTVGSLVAGASTSLNITATVNHGTGSVTNVAQVSSANQLDVDSTPGNGVAVEDDQDDASLTPTGSLSGVFFMDMDSGGDRDASEPIVGGATVRLYVDANQDGAADGTSIASTTTDASTGAYRFDGLAPRGYVVEFVEPNGETFTARNAVNHAIDSDVNPATGITGTEVVMSGNETPDVDAGLLPIDLSLTKTVNHASPAPGSNVVFTLTLSNSAGLSDASGVRVVDALPSGLTFTSANPSGAYDSQTGTWSVGTLASGASTALSITATVDSGTGALTNLSQVSAVDQLDVDSTPNNNVTSEDDQDTASIVPTGALSGVMFWDMDIAGDQDASEPIVGGQTVRLYQDADANGVADGGVIASTTTSAATGAYRFDGLAPNNYIVAFTTPSGEAFTARDAVNDVIDSDANPANGRTGSVVVVAGRETTDVDAGLLPIDLSLSKTVDDASPAPGSNVTFTLTLTNAGGRSDATGVAVRDALPAGLVFVSASPASTYNSVTGEWSVGSLASGASTSLTITANVPAGVGPLTNVAQVRSAAHPDVDSTPNNNVSGEDDQDAASLTPTGALEGAFFWDMDLAGDQDVTEPIVGGATVRLYQDSDANGVADGVVIASTSTNATTGAYRFDDLAAGTYVVEFITPRGETFTARDAVSDTIDSDVNTATGFTGSVNVTSGQVTRNVDAGLLPVDLSLTKTVDVATPAPGSNVVFTLTASNASGRSNATGVTVVDVLPTGLTFVSASPAPAFNAGTSVWTVGSLTSGATSSLTITATVDAGSGSVTNIAQVRTADQPDEDSTPNNSVPSEDDQDDASVTPTGALSGVFFWDMDLAGDQDASEPIVGGATVRLFADADSNGVPDGAALAATATHSSTGAYRFDGLNPGAYLVEFVTPNGETFTVRDAVTDLIDSDANPANGRTGTVLVASGNETTDIDAGLLPIDLSLTKTVNDDSPAPGTDVTFTLTVTNASGSSDAMNVSVTDVLPSGLTFVAASPLSSFDSGTGVWTVGSVAAGASKSLTITAHVNAGTGPVKNSAQVTTTSQPDRDSTPDNDVPSEDDQDTASLTPTGSLSGVFFWDMDTGGDEDAGEPIVGGQAVSLYVDANSDGQADGASIRTATTDATSGAYRFVDLEPGAYLVGFAGPNGETFTARDAVDDLIDSDAGANGRTRTVSVVSGSETADVDAGLLPIDLSLTKTVDDELPAAGQDVVFTLTLTNAPGRSTATGVTVTDALPAGLTFVSASASAEYNNATGVWTVGSLASAASRTLQITATVNADAVVVTNVAEVTSADQPDVDSVPDNDSPPEDDRDAQAIIVTGSLTGVYFWDIDGQADQDADEPSVGSGTVYLYEDFNSDGEPDGPTIAVTWADHVDGTYRFDDLLPGTYVVGFEAPNGESFTATDATGNDTTDSDADTVSGRTQSVSVSAGGVTTDVDAGLLPIDLSLTKTVDNASPVAGTNVTYTLTVSNASNAGTATGVTVTDALPTGLSFVSANPGAAFNASSGVWTVGALPAGTSRTLQVTAAVVGFGTISNTAEVTSADQPDRDSTPDNDVPTEDDTDSQTIQSQVPAEVSISDAELVETHVGFERLVFDVTLSQPVPIGFTLDFATSDGTAFVSDNDYVPTTGQVRFEPNQTKATITIPTVGDYGFEHDETLVVTMTNPSIPSLTITDGQGIGVIINDDLNPEGHEDVIIRDTGTIGLPDEVDKFTLNVTEGYRKAFYGILISGTSDGGLRPDVVSIMDAEGNDVSLTYSTLAPGGNVNQSLAVAQLAPGEYTLCIKSVDDTIGDYQVDVFLPGDTGHHLVPEPDIHQLVNAILSDSPLHFFTSCNFDVVLGINHHTGEIYSINLDANRNGRLDEFDQEVVSNNAVGIVSRAELIPLETPFAVQGFMGTTIPLQSIVSELESPLADGSPTIEWSADSVAATYEVVIIDSTNADVQHVTGITSTSYTVTPSLLGGSYSLQVRGVNSAGQGGLWSSPQRFTVDGESRRRGDGGEATETPLAGSSTLDVDGNGEFQFSTDGVILLAHALGTGGEQLASFRATDSRLSGQDIQTNVENVLAALDVDGDGDFVFSSDGIILLAYALGTRGEPLRAFASKDASRSGSEIETKIGGMLQAPVAARGQTVDEVAVGFSQAAMAPVATLEKGTGLKQETSIPVMVAGPLTTDDVREITSRRFGAVDEWPSEFDASITAPDRIEIGLDVISLIDEVLTESLFA